MKKLLVLLVILLLLALTAQVAFAEPPGPVLPSCNMGASWWPPEIDPETEKPVEDTGPGNATGVGPGERGMYHVHTKDMPNQVGTDGYTYGAQHMDIICPA